MRERCWHGLALEIPGDVGGECVVLYLAIDTLLPWYCSLFLHTHGLYVDQQDETCFSVKAKRGRKLGVWVPLCLERPCRHPSPVL